MSDSDLSGARAFADVAAGCVLASLYYGPSRHNLKDRLSFEAAFCRLGGRTLSPVIGGAGDSGDVDEADALEDVVRAASSSYADLIVLRHPDVGAAVRAAKVSRIPVVNAGDGDNEHPTQAMLDVFTVRQEAGRLSDLTVVLSGDLKSSPEAHGFVRLLLLCPGVRLVACSPDELRLPDGLRRAVVDADVRLDECRSLDEARVADPDVVYMTRLRRRSRESAEAAATEAAFDAGCVMTEERLATLPTHCRILHPLPRGRELPSSLDRDRRVVCIGQTGYGTLVRMAVLATLLEESA